MTFYNKQIEDAFKQLLSREDSPNLERFQELCNQFGISLKNENGQYKSLYTILEELSSFCFIQRQKEIFENMIDVKEIGTMTNNFYRPVEYQMTKTAFQELLKTRTAEESKMNPYAFVMKVVNETYGIKGNVKKINIV